MTDMDKLPALDRLRAATRALHDRIEATGAAARIMADGVRAEQYRDFLLRTLAVVGPAESWLGRTCPAAGIADPCGGIRAPSLLADIEALGGGSPRVGAGAAAEAAMAGLHAGRGAVLGCLYVLEGSALGGAMIAKHLRRRFGEQADGFTRFHGGEGMKAGERWRHVCGLLAGLDGNEAAIDEAVRAAEALFGCFLAAYEPSEPERAEAGSGNSVVSLTAETAIMELISRTPGSLDNFSKKSRS